MKMHNLVTSLIVTYAGEPFFFLFLGTALGIAFNPTMPCTALIEYQKWNPRDVNTKMLAKMSQKIFLHTFLLRVSPKTYLTTNKKK